MAQRTKHGCSVQRACISYWSWYCRRQHSFLDIVEMEWNNRRYPVTYIVTVTRLAFIINSEKKRKVFQKPIPAGDGESLLNIFEKARFILDPVLCFPFLTLININWAHYRRALFHWKDNYSFHKFRIIEEIQK